MNSVEFERVLQKLLMRLVWNLLEYFNIYIHLDVNSDVNSQPFFMQFGRYHRLELRQLPSKFGGVWLSTSKVINAKHWANVVTTPADRFSLISQSILNRFLCNFAGTTSNYSGDCPEKFVKFEPIFLKLLVRLVVNLLEYFKIYSFRRQFRNQFSTVYHVILQAPLDGITATAL